MLLFVGVLLARQEGFAPSTLRSEVLEPHTSSLMILGNRPHFLQPGSRSAT